MAGFSVNGRNKISYKVGSDGKVTVNVNGHPVGTFADKTTARQFTSEAKTAIKGLKETNAMYRGKLALKGGYSHIPTTNDELLKAAKGTDKKFIDLKREAVKGGNEVYRLTKKAGDDQLKTIIANNLTKYGTAPAQTPMNNATTQTSSTVSRNQKTPMNNATTRIGNAIRSSSNEINKRAGVGKYRSK